MTNTVEQQISSSAQSAIPCPSWCEQEGEHDIHLRRLGAAEGIPVSLVLASWPRSDEVRVFLKASPIVLLPLAEAAEVAALLAGLGHSALGALIRAAVERAR